ncbi:MAG: aminotransferase class III-fold pyridoxal phosphate-dependent enzyme [Gammaproteobacteria bacterium]|nr:aminotransferase class III-fold pyridoxal phosphate-dependent enzyme [Gammaproteobacteria bacterium]
MMHKAVKLHGWGRVSGGLTSVTLPETRAEAIEAMHSARDGTAIAFGGGRSYGDMALNSHGRVILTTQLNRILSFDSANGEVVCEPGVTFHELLREFLPFGFAAPVSPGTGFVTIGGAVANDVHGKNHDVAGSFGDHVRWIDLLLPCGDTVRLSPKDRPEWFNATIGGLGLTGIMLAVCFTLRRVPTNAVRVEERRIPDLEAFFAAFETARTRCTYSVAWIDALAGDARLGRGILETAEHADAALSRSPPRRVRVPFDFPAAALNPWTVRAFNALYYRRVPPSGRRVDRLIDQFLYPLDAILDWNRLYGRAGFYQFQCVVPEADSHRAIRRLLGEVASARAASFLAVLKTLGGQSQGLLSFPMRGYTLALDLPRRPGTERLIARLGGITLDYGGRVYLAKDACLPGELFQAMYPKLDRFRAVLDELDPHGRMSSDLSRRLGVRGQQTLSPVVLDNSTLGRSNRRCGPILPARQAMSMTVTRENINDRQAPGGRVAIVKPGLLTVEDAKKLSVAETTELFRDHVNPGQLHFLKLLGFNEVVVESAEGMYYTDKRGRRILDFFGGFGSLALGHNHPHILAARKRFQDEKRHEIAIAFMSQYASALSKNLASIAPGDLDMVFLGSAGSEAVEAALKLAEKVQGPRRSTVAYAERSFHGKSRGALSVTDSDFYQSTFRLLDNRVRIPFGDAAALEAALQRDHSIGILILETVQGGAGVVLAAPGYWQEVRRLCDRYNVLWIADEVQCGVGRTGRFFAFEHEEVVPDIVTLAKSLGGSKAAIGAIIARRPLYMTAYGTPKTALIHGPATFGGMGETCCTAIEALNVLYDEGLIDNSATQGAYLLERLRRVHRSYPQILKEVRGQGLMVGVEFQDFSQTLPFGLRSIVSVLDDKLRGSLCGFVGSLLLKDHNILVAFTEYNRNVIRLEPPLIVTREQIETFVAALDEVLSRGITRIITDYAKNFLRKSPG